MRSTGRVLFGLQHMELGSCICHHLNAEDGQTAGYCMARTGGELRLLHHSHLQVIACFICPAPALSCKPTDIRYRITVQSEYSPIYQKYH